MPSKVPAAKISGWGKEIWRQAKEFQAPGTTKSRAFLRWVLQVGYRLEDTVAEDCLCDGAADKQIDAIAVDELAEEIHVYQSHWCEKHGADQGEGKLAQFMGRRHHFLNEAGLDSLLASQPNKELAALVERIKLRNYLNTGFKVRFIFATNCLADPSGFDYARSHPDLELLDLAYWGPLAKRAAEPSFLAADHVFRVAASDRFRQTLPGDIEVVVASVPATDIVSMPGIHDRSVFDMNVRLDLGPNTRVNRELARALEDQDQHPYFIAFHNGLTVVCEGLRLTPTQVKLHNFSIANGCQSVLALNRVASKLKPQLRILVRIVKVGQPGELASQIAYRTNNQSPVVMRDQKANDTIQRELKSEFSEYNPATYDYQIRRGERSGAPVLVANDDVAQWLMAFYVGQPWNAVRRLVLFEDEEQYRRVFHPKIHAPHIILAYRVQARVNAQREGLAEHLQANFALLRIVLIWLVSQLLDTSPAGKRLKDDPATALLHAKELDGQLDKLIFEAVEGLNAFVGERISNEDENGGYYDFKTALKSQKELERLSAQVVKDFKRDVKRGKVAHFSLPTATVVKGRRHSRSK